MTPEERDLISGLFERMRGMGSLDKDRDADALISQSMRQVPDAPYMLVQSVLVQEQALEQAAARIEELEARVRDLERVDERPASGAGGFLGGLLGGGSRAGSERRAGSVPSVAARAPGASMDPGLARGQNGTYAADPARQAGETRRGGGGFMQSAAATAAGVAGGMLLGDTFRKMLGGDAGKAQAATAETGSKPESQAQDTARNQEPQYQDPNDNDPGNYEEASWDDGGDSDYDLDI